MSENCSNDGVYFGGIMNREDVFKIDETNKMDNRGTEK